MSLRAEVTTFAPRNLNAMCRVALVAEQITDDAFRAEWLDCVNDRTLPASQLALAMRAHKIEIGDTSIQRHRRRQCLCWRGKGEAPDGTA